jgi:transmembrane sensor
LGAGPLSSDLQHMTRKEFIQLAKKISQGTASDTDIARYNAWYNTCSAGTQWNESELGKQAEKEQQLYQNIQAQIQTPPRRTVPLIYKLAAAATLLIFATGGYYMLHKKQSVQPQTAQLIKNDIAPGHSQATLTLANGKKIVLTKGLNGQLAIQNKTVISVDQHTITYDADKSGDQVNFNTLSTAKGEQSPYPLVLSDGTKVWLNAESSITFPTAFNQKERIVQVTGEAYFEVMHNAKQPFKVQTQKQTIEDLGTAFDVNAYDPAARTTLVEGSVKVNGMALKPNQQTDGARIKTVNTRRYTAWKNGDFDFEDDNIQTVMRELSRWYNIDVTYQGNISKEGFNAQITRNKNISSILHLLENTKGVHFKIEGRRVTVIE